MNNTGMALGPQVFCKGIEKTISADVDFIRLSSVWCLAKSKLVRCYQVCSPSSQLSHETKWPCRQGLLPLNIS